MKPLVCFFTILFFILLSSCGNEDIDIIDERICSVDVTVNLTDFFSCYNFVDTKHHLDLEKNKRFKSLNAADIYESFSSFYVSGSGNRVTIEVRVLFYNDSGQLVNKNESVFISDYSDRVNQTIKLPTGRYTAIAILTFDDADNRHWLLNDKENLSTACLATNGGSGGSIWSIMSYASQEVVIGEKNENKVQMTPAPVGALCYVYYQNFQENKRIASIRVCSDTIAQRFMLDPNSQNRYIIKDTGGSKFNWLNNMLLESTPKLYFDGTATYFQDDFFDYFYILAPRCNLYFSYYQNGPGRSEPIELPACDIENGRTYMIYWDYNHLDNPYFGLADNDHWY
ncbi:MAG: hypothetical protein IJV11_10565 [Muribaculaceae bacterium]|nr:hypothetical protein [Muribaculaceae bacterium]